MKQKVECYRCGKEFDFSKQKIETIIECGHCHGKMTIDKKTDRHVSFFLFIPILVLVLFAAFLFRMLGVEVSSPSFMIIYMLCIFVLFLFMDSLRTLSLRILSLFSKISYEEYNEKELMKAKKEEEKQKAKAKRAKQLAKEKKRAKK